MKSKITILMVMLVLAIVAVGSVSATEDVSADVIDESADDIVIDEIATDDAPTGDSDEISDDVVTQTRSSYTVNSSMSSDNSEQQVSESNQDSYSSSDDLIINPDFSDDIGNGWTIAGSVSKYENGRDGSCIKFDKGDSSISQNINWTSINKISFFYKSNSQDNVFSVKIGNNVVFDPESFPSVNWEYIEYDTSSLNGLMTLTIASEDSSMFGGDGIIYLDSIKYAIKSAPEDNEELISNPDFSDGLNGWNYEGSVFPYKNGQNGSCISLIKGKNTVGYISSISQNIDWTSINKISFYYKSTAKTDLIVAIGNDEILQNYSINPSDWIYFEYDTSSISGFNNLTFKALNGASLGEGIYLDTIQLEVKTAINTTISLDIHDENVIITLRDIDKKPIVNANVTYKVNGVETNATTNENGSITISNLKGLIEITANYLGNDSYLASNSTKTFIFKYDTSFSSEVNGNSVIITLKDDENKTLSNANVTYKVNGVETNATTNENGSITISNLKGIITIFANYLGDELHTASNTTKEYTFKYDTSMSAPAVSTTYNVAKNLLITLKDDAGKIITGKQVTVKVGTISKTLTTDSKGQVSVDIASLVPKTYTASISFVGDDLYTKSSTSAKVVVAKATPKLTAAKKTFKVKTKTKKYVATLKTNKGKALGKVKVTLKVKGKTYKATTNAKGKATFKITKLTKKGTFKATVKFAGNSYYKAISKKVKIVVKK